jgi:hypothetical protein
MITPVARSVAEQITAEVQKLTGQWKRQPIQQRTEQHGAVRIGEFMNTAGARVSVELCIAAGSGVRTAAVATCSGFGCTDPVHQVPTGDWVYEADHDERTREKRHEALEWAQAHAERCRAVPVAAGRP